jgi:hypothetical protein
MKPLIKVFLITLLVLSSTGEDIFRTIKATDTITNQTALLDLLFTNQRIYICFSNGQVQLLTMSRGNGSNIINLQLLNAVIAFYKTYEVVNHSYTILLAFLNRVQRDFHSDILPPGALGYHDAVLFESSGLARVILYKPSIVYSLGGKVDLNGLTLDDSGIDYLGYYIPKPDSILFYYCVSSKKHTFHVEDEWVLSLKSFIDTNEFRFIKGICGGKKKLKKR